MVTPDETLTDLADEYNADMQAIADYVGNGLTSVDDPCRLEKNWWFRR
ncbi:MAG: hypothetical protein IPK16_01910 [Anaerolineales bacterium]|nr:hypothetical protein [Anaerolineales bacterium]